MIDTGQLWIVIPALAVGTYLIRYSFFGLIGDADLPPWVMRHLRYTAVAVLPGLIAPFILWPAATGGAPDAARLAAAAVTLGVGVWRKSVLGAVLGGFGTLYAVQWLTG